MTTKEKRVEMDSFLRLTRAGVESTMKDGIEGGEKRDLSIGCFWFERL
jgi:hypothetical protein